jgi:hypothetical protein
MNTKSYTANAIFAKSSAWLKASISIIFVFALGIHGYSQCVTPSTQASGLTAVNVTAASVTLTWTPGNGEYAIVAVREGGC